MPSIPPVALFWLAPLLMSAVAILIGLVAIRRKGPMTRVFQLTDGPEAKLIGPLDSQDMRKIEKEFRAHPSDLNLAGKLIRGYIASGDGNKISRALEILRRGRSRWAESADYHSLVASVYMQMSTPIEDPLLPVRLAHQAAESAAKLDPANPKRWILLGYIHWKLGETASAIETTQEGVRRLNNWRGEEGEKLQAAGWGNLAYYYALGELSEKREEAIDFAAKALSLFPNAHTLDTMAFVLMTFRSGDSDAVDSADQMLRRALEHEDAPRPTIEEHLRQLQKIRLALAKGAGEKASGRSS